MHGKNVRNAAVIVHHLACTSYRSGAPFHREPALWYPSHDIGHTAIVEVLAPFLSCKRQLLGSPLDAVANGLRPGRTALQLGGETVPNTLEDFIRRNRRGVGGQLLRHTVILYGNARDAANKL